MVCFSNEKRKKKKKTVEIPDITIDDIHQRNFKTNPSWPRMKYLESVIMVALDKYEEAKNHDDHDDVDVDDDGDQEKYFLKKRKLISEKLLKKPMMVPTLDPTLKFNIKNRKAEDEEKYCFVSQKEKSKKRGIDVSEKYCPDLPQEFRDKIKELNCPKEAVFLIQKSLTSTDAAKDQSRLSMPFGQLKNNFLEIHEKIRANARHGLKVNMFIEPSVKESEMVLRRWNMKKKKGKTSSMYAMINKWNEVRKRNGLEAGDVIQVWAFRNVEEELGLALVRVSGGGENSGTGDDRNGRR
ncbi:hypothetical protein SLEP1_g3288 [Rubroshorea leprosula]|uniref:B3 domain-containing protein n=1 Tax=Rubroshorea leprosula TaxID=152421 RepID=A0AAV5HU98_9ROSI|nr:hypothetical protein SLEP1_g3288 [Rubroshorea leprosula]